MLIISIVQEISNIYFKKLQKKDLPNKSTGLFLLIWYKGIS